LIAVSDATAADLLAWMPQAAGRISVIPHGVDERFFCARKIPSASNRYILTASTLHPHKNVERLLEAFALFHQRRPAYRLVIAGLRGFVAQRVEALAARLGLNEVVNFTGWIAREELYSLFDQADAFIAPSLFEGFGLTVLEAMASGLPLACSAIEPLRSLTGDAAEHFDPYSIESLVSALEKITQDTDFRTRAAVAGPARAREYTWRRAAECTLRELISARDSRSR
jgi:glycosyltransferase involved in cell wall biosynthesis